MVPLHACTYMEQGSLELWSSINFAKYSYFKNHMPKKTTRCISCLLSNEDGHQLPSQTQLSHAKLIYSVADSPLHNPIHHPESVSRFSVILSTLRGTKLTPKFRGTEVILLDDFKPASIADICSIHEVAYVHSIKKAANKASDCVFVQVNESSMTRVTSTSFHESLIAAGAGLALVDSVVAASNMSAEPPVGFSLIRPPGHHALPNAAMGYSIFGNIAIAARYVQRVHGLVRVFIIDFDALHGNGTENIFYQDPDVFFLSVHQEGSYPYTGEISKVGSGKGEGTTLNLPIPGGSGDFAMRAIFEEVIVPSAQRFKPDIILVSAGFNGHFLDKHANFLEYSTATYYMLADSIKQLAKQLCGGRCIFFLEGGYNLKSLSNSVAESFRAILGEPSCASEIDSPHSFDEPLKKVKAKIDLVKCIHTL